MVMFELGKLKTFFNSIEKSFGRSSESRYSGFMKIVFMSRTCCHGTCCEAGL